MICDNLFNWLYCHSVFWYGEVLINSGVRTGFIVDVLGINTKNELYNIGKNKCVEKLLLKIVIHYPYEPCGVIYISLMQHLLLDL